MHDEIVAAVAKITFPGVHFCVLDKRGMSFLQIQPMEGTCNKTEEPMSWRGRKWYLSPHMTCSEIVQTAFLALKTTLEHEMRENFKYEGVAVLGPHWDLDERVRTESVRA